MVFLPRVRGGVRRSHGRELMVFGKLVLTVVTVCLGKCCFQCLRMRGLLEMVAKYPSIPKKFIVLFMFANIFNYVTLLYNNCLFTIYSIVFNFQNSQLVVGI